MCKATEDMRNEAAREAAREKMGYLIGIMAFYIIRLEHKRHRMVQEALMQESNRSI